MLCELLPRQNVVGKGIKERNGRYSSGRSKNRGQAHPPLQ